LVIVTGRCQRQEERRMRMGEMEIHDYARQLLEAHGEMAVVEAAQKARTFEEKGEREEAETWRGIEADAGAARKLKWRRADSKRQKAAAAGEGLMNRLLIVGILMSTAVPPLAQHHPWG
jgi:hypothetical protein